MFKLLDKKKSGLRLGKIKIKNGEINTPFFMPDATRGFVKLLSPQELLKTQTQALVVNTFHLYLQPGVKLIKHAGGIHAFSGWSGPILSDSGGFQVFSLIHGNSKMGKVSDEKVTFKSPLDGSWHEFTPEKSIQIQFDLGVDMMVCLDDCPPNEFSRLQLEDSVIRTIAWARRSKLEYERQIKKRGIKSKDRPLLFAVIQGGAEIDLREKCALALREIGFDGYGFGARPVDENGEFLEEVLRQCAKFIPEDSLRFALGVGTPEDISRCMALGWDMFDCVIPTREGRHGRLYLNQGKYAYKSINILNTKFKADKGKISKNSNFLDLKNSSLSYLHHLFRSNDSLGSRLASINNLEFYQNYIELIKIKLNK